MRRTAGVKVLLLALALLCGARASARAQESAGAVPEDGRLEQILGRAGGRVESYYRGLFSITFTEVLRREELRKDMTAKKSKEFVFETVVVRQGVPGGDEEDFYPKVVRRLKSVNGKPAKPGAEAGEYFTVASLNFLLPKNRPRFEFSLDGEEQVEGRRAFRVRMLLKGQGPPSVKWRRRWRGGSFSVSAPTAYLIWLDAESYEVLRLESRLVEPFEFDSPRAFGAGPLGRFGPSRRLRYAVQDYSVRFRRRQFSGPEQTLLVPERAEALTVIEGASKPRWRTTLLFSDYRRFRSDVKVEEEPDGEGSRR